MISVQFVSSGGDSNRSSNRRHVGDNVLVVDFRRHQADFVVVVRRFGAVDDNGTAVEQDIARRRSAVPLVLAKIALNSERS
jgi:hypothetical protein